MNESENFRGCSFLNLLSEIPANNIKVLNIIQSHKKSLREYFKNLLTDNRIADHIYLLFESAIIESQLFKNQWAVTKSKTIVNAFLN